MSGKYRGNPDWSDITEVPEDDADGVCVISYSSDYVEAMNYFRGVVRQKDLSPRVLSLLDDLLEHNPANYTVWHYRRMLLAALAASPGASSKDIYGKELEYVNEMAEAHPKNYQIWYHRQVIVELLLAPEDRAGVDRELEFVATIFEDDAKNYHAWAYRQWVISRYGAWDEEPAFVDGLITKDIRNNSAWNQRYFVFTKGPKKLSDPAVLQQEITYVLSKIRTAPNNESAWNYFKGILNDSYKDHPEVKEFCLDLQSRGIFSPHLLSALADISVEEKKSEEALKYFDLLETKVDTVHGKYWSFRKSQLAL